MSPDAKIKIATTKLFLVDEVDTVQDGTNYTEQSAEDNTRTLRCRISTERTHAARDQHQRNLSKSFKLPTPT
ncbi:hypothetical protein OUZ56_014389 [Daphnia magna]|uniref:Uncharacterized protein n=1 Tax=Daphnia magna TaxID=35525 RepID=A0ABR0AJS7_9CRUS|nr:hypothetical protein OUZ56_014389 [Daphnia magna]